MTTKEILSFLQQEKITRAQERKEDKEYILNMITTIVDEKVKAAIDPIENKLELQEKVNMDLYSKFSLWRK